MRKFYLKTVNYLQKRIVLALGISVLAFSLQSNMFAQSTWNASISSDVLTTDNWTPAITLSNVGTGVNLVVPRTPLKADNLLYLRPPILSGAQNITVRSCNPVKTPATVNSTDSLDLDGDGIKDTWVTTGKFIVNLDPGYQFTVENGNSGSSNAAFFASGFYVKSGTMRSNRGMRLDSDSAVITIENNGILNLGVELVMGNNNGSYTSSFGGRIVLKDNGKLISASWQGRCTPSKKGPQIYISQNATAEFTGKINFNPHINDSNKISGGADFYPVTKIDDAANRTYLWAVSNHELRIGQTEKQLVTAGSKGKLVSLVFNKAFKDCDPASFQWKYTTTPGSNYVPFSPAVMGDSLEPIFPISGTLYLVCQGNKISDGSLMTSNEVKFVVGSNKAVLSPSGTQYLRISQIGAPITVAESSPATSREWKYSTTSEGPYVSFTVPQTGLTYAPFFDAAGEYYIVCESIIDGLLERSAEVKIIYDLWTAASRSLVWTGAKGTDITDATNFNPIGYIQKNILDIPASAPNMPVLSNAGQDSINYAIVRTNASFTLSKPTLQDTLNVRGDILYLGGGKFSVTSGVAHFSAGLRLTANSDVLEVKGNGNALFKGGLGISFGNAATVTSGGKIIVKDNGIVKHDQIPYRVSANVKDTFSRTSIMDNGQVWLLGNNISNVKTWITNKKMLPDTLATDSLTWIYDLAGNYTRVWAYDTMGFCVAPHARQYVGRNQAATFKAKNIGSTTNLQWKFRKNAADGQNIDTETAWIEIPGANGNSVDVSFTESGDYFVKCVGVNGGAVSTLNYGRVVVVAIDLAPIATQQVTAEFPIDSIIRVAPAGRMIGEWKYSTTLGSGYTAFPNPADADSVLDQSFMALGVFDLNTYYIVYETAVTNDEGESVSVFSNVVTVILGTEVGVKNSVAQNSAIYPNPTSGNFTVKAAAANFTVEIIDAKGSVVYTKKFVNSAGAEKVTFAKKGVYVVKVKTGKDVKVSRLLVK